MYTTNIEIKLEPTKLKLYFLYTQKEGTTVTVTVLQAKQKF